MRSVQPTSASSPPDSRPRPWLEAQHRAKAGRTVDIVQAAVKLLCDKGETVTIQAICKASQEVDPTGRGVGQTAVLRNPEAYAIYQQHSMFHKSGRRRSTGATRPQPALLQPGRDPNSARRRYLKQSKTDLVDRLLAVEQAYLDLQDQLARLQFQLLETQEP